MDVPRAPTPDEREIVDHVAEYVRFATLTEQEIAKKARWHPKRLQRLLAGETRLRATDMRTLARVLRKPIGELFPPNDQRRAA